MKKLLFILIISMMIVPTYAEDASDWAQEFIEEMNIDPDYSDGRLDSDYKLPITRKDFAYIGVKVYEAITGENCEMGHASFIDTTDEFILKAKNHELVGGYGNGLYGPDNYITRQDLTLLLKNVLDKSGVKYEKKTDYHFKDENLFADYAKEAIYIAYVNNIVRGIGEDKFNPLGNATREEAVIMLIKMQRHFEEMKIETSNNRNYNWYIDQENTGDAANNNCGPSSAVMAAKFQNKSLTTTAEQARNLYPKDGGWWTTNEISNFFENNEIINEIDDYDGYFEIKDAIDQGDIVLVCIDTTYLSEKDIENDQTGRFYTYQGGHFIVVKGYKKIDGQFYFEVYDPNNWSETQNNGVSKGQDRYYLASELTESIEVWWPYYYIIKSTL